MSVYLLKAYIRTADYLGTDRRDGIERRVALDPQFLLDAVLTRVSVNRIFPSHRYTVL